MWSLPPLVNRGQGWTYAPTWYLVFKHYLYWLKIAFIIGIHATSKYMAKKQAGASCIKSRPSLTHFYYVT